MTEIITDEHLSEDSLSRLEEWADGRTITLVCDPNTYLAFGKELEVRLDANLFQFYEPPIASLEAIKTMKAIDVKQAVVAVGSGTINDLCKYLSYQRDQSYACIPTALSMNGYLSATASLEDKKHHKQSYEAAPPALLLADLSVLAAAPKRLMRAGLGDSICRSTAQVDWLLSHFLNDTEYNDVPYQWLAPYEKPLLEQAKQLGEGDLSAYKLLLDTLLASGKGMAYVGSSAPASQAEHAIAHAMHALHPKACEGLLHGEEIAVTTMIVARIHSDLLDGDTLSPDVIHALYDIHVAPDTLEKALLDAGCPTTIEDIGWHEDQVEEAILHAPSMRDRFTVLNLF